jgi:hypothetical protein
MDTPWVDWTLFHCTPIKRGKVSSNLLTHEGTWFEDSMPRMHQYTTQTCSLGPDEQSLIDSSGGHHHGSPNIRSDHPPSFSSSILHFPLSAPPDLQLCQPFNHLAKPHRTSIIRKGHYHERIPTTRLLLIAYPTKHSILSLCFFHRNKQGGLVRVLLVQLGFH